MALLGPAPRPQEALMQALESAFGGIDFRGDFLPFDVTDYYAAEFGPGLARGWISFRGLGGPEELAAKKAAAAALERAWAKDDKRLWNLDIGYMDPDKLVLASYKRGPCKLYLGHGVYADLLLKYAKGRFDPLPWAFADFKDDRYSRNLLTIREKLKSELHKAEGHVMEKAEGQGIRKTEGT
jgi:hypothetical protein